VGGLRYVRRGTSGSLFAHSFPLLSISPVDLERRLYCRTEGDKNRQRHWDGEDWGAYTEEST
jgi:hypothetical protein